MRLRCLTMAFLLVASASLPAQTSEQRTQLAFQTIRGNPQLLLAFLRDMPKGADLHNHLAGAIYAESFIDFGAREGLCVDRTTAQVLPSPCQSCDKFNPKPGLKCAYENQVLYNSLIDAWSMRNWHPAEESGHDHFFGTFDKFFPAMQHHFGESLAEVAARAAHENLQYLELMHTADGMQSALLGQKLGWSDDFSKMRDGLLAGGLKDVIADTRAQLDKNWAVMQDTLHCSARKPDPGCAVNVRFLYQVLRGLPKEQVFAQILLGFELAQADSRFVGLNLVMPEDWYVPIHDFDLHMRILDYLHGAYPKVHIALHAGELAMSLVPPEALQFHIRDSIEKGHAERIGHGVSVMYENHAIALLQQMADKNVLVEICLTSNDSILGVSAANHPLTMYRKFKVPVALATDDAGVSRSDMTQEYLRAVRDQSLDYVSLKRMARDSLEHSFLPGKSLWENVAAARKASVCPSDRTGAAQVSTACQKFLGDNERALEQWKLEKAFAEFEARWK